MDRKSEQAVSRGSVVKCEQEPRCEQEVRREEEVSSTEGIGCGLESDTVRSERENKERRQRP